MPIVLSERELATLLAALRRWQQDLEANADSFVDMDHFDERIMPLASEEIDELCERLNFGSHE